MDGFIYILSNPEFKGLKIGQSSKHPEERRKELSSETGVPAPYKIEYYAFVENYESVERQIHSKLDSHRPRKYKEHFTCSVPEAIIVIEDIANVKYKEVFYKSTEEILIEKKRQEAEITRVKALKEEERILKEKEIKKREEDRERQILREQEVQIEQERLRSIAIKKMELERNKSSTETIKGLRDIIVFFSKALVLLGGLFILIQILK